MKLTKKYSKPEGPVKDEQNNPATDIKEQGIKWVEQLEEIMNRPAPLNPQYIKGVPTDLSIDVTPPAIEEIRMANG
ncbi:unnamed protein product [Schistosoma curassoni]|uniref:Chromosome partitioning protein ParB n=1 Tax=Schistosoma curassoni TaxID=6186 RepID=A0A183JNC2_9TREM|nr:unnamed protein product [Schistosoma curassoni]